jgi:DNA polymerase-3 subunit gamma/tau
MSFEVTATKKRPQLFDQLVGQDFVVSTLKNSIEQSRIAHAYLFSGPRGVGKTSAARILAKALNCEQGPTTAPCGECSQCREIARGTAMDVIEIDGASNTSVNDVRELKDEVLFAPNSSRYKIYIIDEVHMLSNSAFNALLKTIEEPPPYIVFIFATTEVHKVPATIRSRCQQFNFRLLQVDTLKEQVAATVAEMSLEAEDEALFWIAKEATGSLRDAYTLLDQIVSFSEGTIKLATIQEKLGLAGAETIDTMAEAMADGDADRVFAQMEEVLGRGVPVEQFVVDLTEYFRNILFIKHGIERESILGYPVSHFSSKVRETFSTAQIEYAVELLLELYRSLRFSLNQRFELELALSKLSSLSAKLSGEELLYEIENLREELIQGAAQADGPSDSSAPQASSPESTGSPAAAARPSTPQGDQSPREAGPKGEAKKKAPEAEQLNRSLTQDETARIKEELSRRPTLASALDKACAWELSGETLSITCKSSYPARKIREELSALREVTSERLGRRVDISVRVLDNTKENPTTGAGTADEQIELVKKVFRGRILHGANHESDGSF